ncbi:hypothetical protein [Actinomycetospora termitidis]|uniref:Uncharacterized protein n=1 Tax=Actinomycetospora termitidis TaxID=3053470 RepID=A0ABT7MAA3_9PSEU|nr:hypothetical protein [Actinomycetospora sp. Odt1-22]MDL5157585.1 hypothetical protein [Actinomycetospora sp. Odt1-22]
MNIDRPVRELLVEPVVSPLPDGDPAGAPRSDGPDVRVPGPDVARRPDDPGAASPARV